MLQSRPAFPRKPGIFNPRIFPVHRRVDIQITHFPATCRPGMATQVIVVRATRWMAGVLPGQGGVHNVGDGPRGTVADGPQGAYHMPEPGPWPGACPPSSIAPDPGHVPGQPTAMGGACTCRFMTPSKPYGLPLMAEPSPGPIAADLVGGFISAIQSPAAVTARAERTRSDRRG